MPPKTTKKAAGSTISEVLKTTKKVVKKLAEMPVRRHSTISEKRVLRVSATIQPLVKVRVPGGTKMQ
jgi:hypothetical protein